MALHLSLIHISLAAEGFTHCALILQQEFSGLRQELKASFSGIEGDRACFALDFSAPAEPELVWYAFRLWRDDGSGLSLIHISAHSGYPAAGGAEPSLWLYHGTGQDGAGYPL